jgi:hypothetical protein
VWELDLRNKFYLGRGLTDVWDDKKHTLFYLQLRDDVAQGKLSVSDDTAIQLAGLAAQAQCGNFDPKRHQVECAHRNLFV